MKISPVAVFSFNKTGNCKNYSAKYKYDLSYDTFSFTGQRYPSREEILGCINDGKVLSQAGLKGTVYRLDKNGKSYAVKVSREQYNSFEKEADLLKYLPSGMGGQHYVDYFQHPETGFDILVTTFIQGSKGVLNSINDFSNFLEMLLQLDKTGVLHGDLNMQNCLFHNGKVNLIDFAAGEIYKIGESYKDFIYPEFVLKSNIINLEHNGIPDCIKNWSKNNKNVNQNFRGYLKAKSEFFDRHIKLLKTNGIDSKDAIAYEENLSRVLKNPSDAVLENEIRRIDCLYAFEYADNAVNYEKNITASKRNWNITIEKSKSQLEFIERNLQNPGLTADERKYFTYQQKILQSFNEKFNSWSSSTVEWLDNLDRRNDLSDFEKEFIKNREKKPSDPPPDLVKKVII